MHQNQYESQIQQDETDLFNLVRILFKRWMLIVSGTLFATIAAGLISFFLPKVYEVSTIIEPGKIKAGKGGEEIYVISPESVRESVLGETYDFRIKNSLNISTVDYPKFKVTIPKGTSLVKVSVETSNPLLSKDILELMNKLISDDVDSKLEFEKRDIDNQIKTALIKNKKVAELVDITNKQIVETKKKIQLLEKSKLKALLTNSDGAMNVLLYSKEIQDQQIYLNSLEEKIKNYEEEAKGSSIRIDSLQLQADRLKGMNIVKPVTVSDRPVKPNKRLVVTLSFVSSLLLMIIIAYFLNYIENRSRPPQK